MYSYNPYYYNYLAHHGVKGQRWGIRRYQPYTSANKGVFKNLKRTYKSSVRSLKKERKRYEEEGDELAVAAANKAIKDTKKSYKTERNKLREEFKAENRANYIQEVSEKGNEKQVSKVRKEMSPEQLERAVRRINAYKDWEKLSMRDVEKEVAHEEAMKKLERISKGADTVSRVAVAASNVTSAYKGFKDLFKKPSEHDKTMNRLAEERAAAEVENVKAGTKQRLAQALSVLNRNNDSSAAKDSGNTGSSIPKNTGNTGSSTSKDSGSTGKAGSSTSKDSGSGSQWVSPHINDTNPYKNSKASGFEKLSKPAQNGVRAYERTLAKGGSEKMAEANRVRSIILSDKDSPKVPLSVIRTGQKEAHQYIIDHANQYETHTVSGATEWLKKHAGTS